VNIWTKLPTGWGIRVKADVEPQAGESVKVEKRDGSSSSETIGQVLRKEGDSFVCTVAAKPRQPATKTSTAPQKSVNRRPGACERCGTYLQPGQGRLQFCMADSGCMKHFDDDGYHLYCLDEQACAAAKKELVKDREEAQRVAGLVKAAIPDQWTAFGVSVENITDGAVVLASAFSGSMGQVDRGTAYAFGEDLFVQRHEYDWGPVRHRIPGKAAEYRKVLEIASNGKKEVMAGGITLKVT